VGTEVRNGSAKRRRREEGIKIKGETVNSGLSEDDNNSSDSSPTRSSSKSGRKVNRRKKCSYRFMQCFSISRNAR
jgi:hypothetical protein